jgi:acetyl-CoA acetyltransferase
VRAAIAGVGESAYARWGRSAGRSELGLACDAILAALGDARIEPEAVDGLASFSSDANQPALVQAALGLGELRHSSLVWGGGGGGCLAAIANAAAAVASGQASTVLVYRALAQGQTGRLGAAVARGPLAEHTAPFGLTSPAQNAALAARRFMHERGATSEHLCEIAVTARTNAQGNPRAVMNGKPLDEAGYFASRMVADPLRLLDCCLECDAAAAVVVTSLERARDMRRAPVAVLSAMQGGAAGWGLAFNGGHNQPLGDYVDANAAHLASALFAEAGVRPADIDVAQLYDAFTPMVLVQLEAYGFCGRGESGAFVASGALRRGGALPFNTAGGSLSEAYVHGLNLVVEAVRQVRGEALNQVPDAELAFVGGGPGVAPTSAMIVGRA